MTYMYYYINNVIYIQKKNNTSFRVKNTKFNDKEIKECDFKLLAYYYIDKHG